MVLRELQTFVSPDAFAVDSRNPVDEARPHVDEQCRRRRSNVRISIGHDAERNRGERSVAAALNPKRRVERVDEQDIRLDLRR